MADDPDAPARDRSPGQGQPAAPARRPLVNRRDLLRLNPGELIFDLVLLLYAELFLYRLVAPGGALVDVLPRDLLFAGGLLIDFFVIWYLGVAYTRFRRRTENVLVLGSFLVLGLWLVISLHLGVAVNLTEILGGMSHGDNFFHTAAWAPPLVVTGITGGLVFACTEPKAARGEAVLAERAGALKKVVPIGMASVNIAFAWRIVDQLRLGGFWLGLVIWSILVAGSWAVVRAVEACWGGLSGGRRRALARGFMGYLFPLLLVTLICLWDEIFLWGRIAPALKSHETLSVAGMLAYLFVSGIIPLRIVMALEPPLSLITVSTGVASLGYFLYSVAGMMRNLFG